MAEFAVLNTGDPLEPDVERLVDDEFAAGFGGPYWRWKYRHHESLPNAGIFTASLDGELVGALHFLRNRFRLGGGAVVNGVALGDLVTDSRHRGKAAAGGLSLFASEDAEGWDPPPDVVVVWTRPRLGRFFTKALGYTRVPSSTIRYEKHLGFDRRVGQLTSGGLLNELAEDLPAPDAPPVIFRIDGTLPFAVTISGGKIEVTNPGGRRVVITGPRRLVRAYLDRSDRKLVLANRVRRRLKVRGRMGDRRRVAPFSAAYLAILSALIDD